MRTFSAQQPSSSWNPNKGNEYVNPVINADYSDPDVCRVGNDYYMTVTGSVNLLKDTANRI